VIDESKDFVDEFSTSIIGFLDGSLRSASTICYSFSVLMMTKRAMAKAKSAVLSSLAELPVHILGAGAMGMLCAASIKCAFPSYPVKLILRDTESNRRIKMRSVCLQQTFDTETMKMSSSSPPSQSPINSNKLRQRGPRVVHIPCETTVGKQLNHKRDIAHLLVTTKAGSAVPALTSVEHRLCTDPPCTIVLLCNGALAVADEWREHQQRRQVTSTSCTNTTLQPTVPKDPFFPQLLFGISTHGVYRETTEHEQEEDDLYHIVHAGYGSTILEGSPELATLLDHSGLNCTLIPSRTDHDCHDDYMKWLLWKKLAVNCVINPLSAIHNCVNGDIVRLNGFHDHYYPALLSELANVFVQTLKHSNSSAINTELSVEYVQEEFRNAVDDVVRDTARNRSSMLQDVAAGRSTEVDYLSGYVVRTGAALGVPTPVNAELWSAVQSLSSQR
jgi:2-dehydropantoate 2-reductase